MAKKYKKVCVAFDKEQYAQAIMILDKISRVHRLLNKSDSRPISTTPFTRKSDRIRVPFPVSVFLLQEDI
jgi:hypothetical protein